jgi:hypothetical protein
MLEKIKYKKNKLKITIHITLENVFGMLHLETLIRTQGHFTIGGVVHLFLMFGTYSTPFCCDGLLFCQKYSVGEILLC